MGIFSNLFGGSKEDEGAKALKEALSLMQRVIEDEEFQLEFVHPVMKKMIEAGPVFDRNPKGTGPFGFVDTNPIPVNGPNYARPYPPPGGVAALPKPNPPRALPGPGGGAREAADARARRAGSRRLRGGGSDVSGVVGRRGTRRDARMRGERNRRDATTGSDGGGERPAGRQPMPPRQHRSGRPVGSSNPPVDRRRR